MMDFNIRAVTQKEYETDAKRVWNACFPEDGTEFIEYYFKKRSCRGNVIAAFAGDKMAGTLHILPRELCFLNERKRVALIAGVGTFPAFRMQGAAAGLLRAAEPLALKKGCSAAILQPFSFGFYRKFGYETFACSRVYTRFPEEAQTPAKICGDPDTKTMLRAYSDFTAPYCGAAVRTEVDFQLIIEEARISSDLLVACEAGYAWGRIDKEAIELYELAGTRPIALVDALLLEYGRPVRYRLPSSCSGGDMEPFNMIKILDEAAFMEGIKLPKQFWRSPEYAERCLCFERY